jgi:hypothetical protein
MPRASRAHRFDTDSRCGRLNLLRAGKFMRRLQLESGIWRVTLIPALMTVRRSRNLRRL